MEFRRVRTPDHDDLVTAWRTISARLAPTPVHAGGDFHLKLESFQPTGAFKIRGALNALSTLPPDVVPVTASAGNHGLGVAHAARLLGRRATVVVPGNASPAKVAALRATGIDLVEVGTSYDDAERHALGLTGAYYLSPYNDPAVIAGQGTIGFELREQVPGPLTVVCAVGGGGLAAGLGLWASRHEDIRVIGVEAAESTAVSAAVRAGRVVDVPIGETIADGVAGGVEPGSVTIGLIATHVHELLTVTETEIRAAMRYLLTERGVVAEGAGALPVAALLAGKGKTHGTTVAVVSGRNITLPALLDAVH
ncbi:threonine ammonia-lyase [Amycolatopsis albispora]|uniref:Threonine dehydratase n=1 Tax=Amycolatopsis albispora TaxID=1804986 RepID=A0A344L9B3_9PSEU|nr:pyridoxal-phosphate dependent enzyme [Amycolatopsis albispora]AXB44637.1 threonine dehydratase [Amycolatopsis albispora]